MPRFVLLLLPFLVIQTGYTQHAGSWIGAGEYLPGSSIASTMRKMAADKKLSFHIDADGSVSGKLVTLYNRTKAVIPNESGTQFFTLTGKYNADKNSLLLIITHFRSKSDSAESYLTFKNPDSVYYDLSVSEQNNRSMITAVANQLMNKNASIEWVGSFIGGGLAKNIRDTLNLHILPLRIRFDNGATISLPLTEMIKPLYSDLVIPVTIVPARTTNIQRVISLDTSFIKLELYDNGEIDGDIASLVLDGDTILNKQLLGSKPVIMYVNLSKKNSEHTLELFANNLGAIPPNTALLILTCNEKRYEINLSSNETANGAVKLVFK